MTRQLQKQVTRAAKQLLDFFGPKGERWTCGAYARDASGKGVLETEPGAVQWCLSGALRKLQLENMDVRLAMARETKEGSLAKFNDTSHHYRHVKQFLTRLANPKPKEKAGK